MCLEQYAYSSGIFALPPRKKPPAKPTINAVAASAPSVHLDPFIRYLRAECGMSANTIKAYGSDLAQFFEWYRQHGPSSLRAVHLKILTAYLGNLNARKLSAT